MIESKDLPAVVSYWRSGAHWLCSLMYQWFYFGRLKEHLMPDAILPFRTWDSDNAKSYRWASLLGGHIYDPESATAKGLGKRKIIYLFRSGRETLPSLWRLRSAEARIKGAGPWLTFPEFLRARPPIEEGNAFPEGLNMRDLCHWSQAKWMEADVYVVWYRQMVENLEGVRNGLAGFLGKTSENLRFPADRRVGYVVPQGRFTNDELWGMVK